MQHIQPMQPKKNNPLLQCLADTWFIFSKMTGKGTESNGPDVNVPGRIHESDANSLQQTCYYVVIQTAV